MIVAQGQGAGTGQAIEVNMALDISDPEPVCLGDGQWQLAGITAHIGFELALSSQIVGIGFLQRIRVQYAIIQHRFTLDKIRYANYYHLQNDATTGAQFFGNLHNLPGSD
ncbi:hypothetical protein D3C84_875810 [compost metagenome]